MRTLFNGESWLILKPQRGSATRWVGLVGEVHVFVPAVDVNDWLPRKPAWPHPREWVRERLPRVMDDKALHATADAVIARYEEAAHAIADEVRALVHSDLGLHNISIDPVGLTLFGVFDWESACWADRHIDFRYFTLPTTHDAVLAEALVEYEAVTGCRLDQTRIYLYNAASAIGYLAFRDGIPPDQQWCPGSVMVIERAMVTTSNGSPAAVRTSWRTWSSCVPITPVPFTARMRPSTIRTLRSLLPMDCGKASASTGICRLRMLPHDQRFDGEYP